MKNKILLKTNLSICLVIVVGFLLTAVLSYRINYHSSIQNIVQVSDLASEGVYYQMNTALSKPVNISQTMANNSLLKTLLTQEPAHSDDPAYIATMQKHLLTYQQKYAYDSVFLVSAASNRYYNFNGLDRVLAPGNAEDAWYFDDFLPSAAEYSMNVDNDQVAGAEDAITLFVNCKIWEGDTLLGVVGVGVRIDHLQKALQSYQDSFDVSAYFVDDAGVIQLAASRSGYERVNLRKQAGYSAAICDSILGWRESEAASGFWSFDGAGRKQDYFVTRYLPDIGWHLVVERDTGALMAALQRQLKLSIAVIVAIIAIILLVITRVIRGFDRRIAAMARANEQERQTLFEKATGQLFDDIYEIDITHNRPSDQVTEAYFARLGAPPGTPYDQALHMIAEKQIKPEFRQGYLDTFSPAHVLRAFEEGAEALRYEFMIANDGQSYYWMRITARLLVAEGDGSLHMMIYRQNIDEEKRREQKMQLLARTDEMTGLLNKTATQRAIEERLAQNPEGPHAFFIFDIDRFKDANDRFGHAYGDNVIRDFADILRAHFRRDDLLGRIGGDEFVAFLPIPSTAWAADKARELTAALDRDHTEGESVWHMTASIGVAFAPQDGAAFAELYRRADTALYVSKKRGRHRFTLYQKEIENGGGTRQ